MFFWGGGAKAGVGDPLIIRYYSEALGLCIEGIWLFLII
jgi:hypothetical protein